MDNNNNHNRMSPNSASMNENYMAVKNCGKYCGES